MYKPCKVSAKIIAVWLCTSLLFLITIHVHANDNATGTFFKSLTQTQDTTRRNNRKPPVRPNTTVTTPTATDTTRLPVDTTKRIITDTMHISKDSLDAPVKYSAEDSGVLIIPTKQFILYKKATVDYNDIKLDAGTIIYDQQTQVVKAFGGTDTSKGALNKAKITQAGAESISDTIEFNIKSQRGLSKNTYYTEGELFVNAERVKKIDKVTAYAYRGLFTTCNLDTPHFGIRARKLKMINNKIAVSGPAFPEFEGVPMPVGIPFGIYPLNRGRHSGLLPPQYTSNQSFGLGLEGLGFYKVLSDNWDVTVRGNIYSYGGWNIDITPDYYKRYKYRGNMTVSFQHTKIINTYLSKETFSVTPGFFITWSHSSDTRSRPGTSFSANVRAGSTKYNQNVANNAFRNYENQLSSSITYNKMWDQGKYNLTVSANHNQNNNLGLINLNIPTVTFSATTIYPFQKLEQVGTPKWYQKLGISYNGTLISQASFYDSAFDFKRLLDTAQWGADHRIPITLSLPALGPFIIAPSISYAEKWHSQRLFRTWNDQELKIDTQVTKGFFAEREMSFGISANTRIFGTFNFKKSKSIMAIRHEVKPYLSLNYKPDLVRQYYQDVQIDTFKNVTRVSELSGGTTGAFGEGRFGGLSFGIDNLLEMKVRDKKDTSAEAIPKKVRLIDGLGITSGYNMMVDSFNWSSVNISLRSTLFNKLNITGGAVIDPYKVDTFGRRINELYWKSGKIGRFSSGQLAFSTSLQSKSKDKAATAETLPEDQTLTPDEQMRQLEYIRQNPAEFVDFNIPWNVQLSYSLNFYRTLAPDLKSFITQINSSVNINGDFSLSPKWKIGGGTYFDFKTGRIQTVTMFLTREMHCWQMAMNIQVGQFKSFSVTLNPKSGILRDLRINKRFLQQ